MSALSAAASDEDGDIISALREKLGRAHALCRIRLDRIRELEAMLYAVGAGGVGKVEQPQPDTGIPASVPPGWQLVPVEPTREMKSAGAFAAAEANNRSYSPAGVYIPVDAMALMGYRAMLAAAPQPSVVEQTQDGTKQVPIAYEFYNPATGHAIVDYDEHTHVGHLSADKGYIARPLYTRPQPSQPLTDEMVELGWELHGSSDAYQAWSLAVEWTERAHGIGSEA